MQRLAFEPPPTRLALPPRVRQLRLEGPPVGTYFDADYPDGIPLLAVGANLCQTGWVVQGYLQPPGAPPSVTPPFHLDVPTLPTGEYRQSDPDVPDQTLVVNLQTATAQRLAGTLAIEVGEGGESVLRMKFDGAPVGVATGPGLGARGCFTTGHFQLEQGAESIEGPVHAVYDQKQLYYMGARLDPTHTVAVWLSVLPAHRQPQNVFRADLARVEQKPSIPIRVVFEERVRGANGVEVREVEATRGELVAAFKRANPQGPIRVDLRGLQFPEWNGPMSGAVVDRLRFETLVVTDLEGSAVPVPSGSGFADKKPSKRPRKDASTGVSPAGEN